MLSKQFRLHGRLEQPFDYSVSTPLFAVIIKKNQLAINRFGFIVSKKIDSRAVVRNTCRRKLSHCIQNLTHKLQIGYDMLFLARKQLALQEQAAVCAEITDTFKKKGLFV